MKNNKRVACILPYSESKYRHRYQKDFIHMSGLITICEYLKQKGIETQIFDYLEEEGSDTLVLDEKLLKFAPAYICIWGMFCVEDIENFVKTHRAILKFSQNIAMGTGALAYKKCLQTMPEISCVIVGNWEKNLEKIINSTNNAWEEVIFRKENGDIVVNKYSMDDLDDIFKYIDPAKFISKTDPQIAYLWGSRGCWYGQCTFCNVGAMAKLCVGSGWIERSNNAIVAEMKYLYLKGVRHFHFLDSEFIGPQTRGKVRALDFAKKIIESGMQISFYIDTRINCIDYETFSLLKRAGLNSVFIGMECACNKSLACIKKGYNKDTILPAIRIVQKLKIPFRLGILIAVPESDLFDIKENLKFLVDNNLYQGLRVVGVGSVFHELHLHLGTEIYEKYVEYTHDRKMDGEVPCYYVNKEVRIFIDYARILQEYVKKRHIYALEKMVHKKEQYLFSLRIISVNGLLQLIECLINGKKDHLLKVINELFAYHDSYWKISVIDM